MLTKDDFIIRGFDCIHLTSRDIGGRACGGVSVLVCVWLSDLDFYAEQHQPSSGFAWPASTKNGKSVPHSWGKYVSAQFAQ